MIKTRLVGRWSRPSDWCVLQYLGVAFWRDNSQLEITIGLILLEFGVMFAWPIKPYRR